MCGKPAPIGQYCEEHEKPSKSVCVSCGKRATHECPTSHQFVCGAPLCYDCRHIGEWSHGAKEGRANSEERLRESIADTISFLTEEHTRGEVEAIADLIIAEVREHDAAEIETAARA
jgi:hypothetical protein